MPPRTRPAPAEPSSPLRDALSKAPPDDEPESEEERAEVEKAREEVKRGRSVSSAELRRRLGLP